MYNTVITLAWLKEKIQDLPDNTPVGQVHKYAFTGLEGSPQKKSDYLLSEPFKDDDVNGDQYLFQVDPETGVFVLGYGF